MQPNTEHTIKDLVRYTPSVIVPSLLGFLAVVLYTRLLSPEEYGLFTLIITTALFIESFFMNWQYQSVLRYYQRFNQEDKSRFFTTALVGFVVTNLAIAVIFLLTIVFVGHLFETRTKELLFYLPLVVLCQSACKLMLVFLRAMRQSSRYSWQQTANAVLKLVAGLAFIFIFDLAAEALILGISLAGAFVFFNEYRHLSGKWGLALRAFDRSIFSDNIKYGYPLVALAVVGLIISASDRYLIKIILDASQVGIYSAGYKIAETGITGLVLFLTLASFPALIAVYENQGETPARDLMKDLFRIYLILMIPATVGIYLLAEDIARVVVGEQYVTCYLVLPWIAAGKFFAGLGIYYNKSFELREKTLLLPILYTGPAILNIVLNLFLIESFGIQGAAISTCLSYLACLALARGIGARYLSWGFPWATALKSLLASAFMTMAVLLTPTQSVGWVSLLMKITVGFFAYTTAIMLLEKQTLRSSIALLGGRAVNAKSTK